MNLFTVLASFISGLLCSMGFGGGSVLIIFLTTLMDMNQKEAQGINLLFFIPCALYSVVKYRKENLIEKSLLKPFILCGIVGVAVGYAFISLVPTGLLRKLFGIFLILTAAKDLFSKK